MPSLTMSLSLRSRLRSSTRVNSYGLLGFNPALVFDFKNDYFRKAGADTTFSSAMTHTRASSATMVNSSGTLVTVGNNVPRTGHHIHNGSAWVNEGILHESEARTNLLLNSGALSTQSATVAAVAHTLSFSGTGVLFLSGAFSGDLYGAGTGENNRVSLTFTPTAGTLTLTSLGAVTNAQLEVGLTPSSYIPTTSAAVTRAAETLTVPAANLPYNSTNMSIQMDGKINYADRELIREVQFVEWLADANNGIEQFACSGTGFFPNGAVAFFQEAAATASLKVTPAATLPFGVNVPFNISSRHGSTFINGAVGGTALTADTTPTALPNLSSTDLNLGRTFMGTIGQFRMWAEDLTDAGITEAST